MPLPTLLRDRFERSFSLYRDLAAQVPEPHLASKLPGLPSNALGLQLWCVVGARESYSAALHAGEWTGFACTLTAFNEKSAVAEALEKSARSLTEILQNLEAFTEVQNRLMLDLLEHEAAHQGQIIRYLYGLRLPIPDSWKRRYALA